jgi:hypothetical protein
MKKILLITVLGTLFAAGSAFAHCGTCGVGDAAHGDKAKAECKTECAKPCCGEKKADCKSECTKEKAEEKAADETAAAKSGACCPAQKAAKPA